jgi:nucleoside-diphosphate-sugar epimerase
MNESKTASLKAFPNAATHLELVPLEMTGASGAFEKAVQDVEWVMHVASPVIIDVKDENELIRPAVEGTLSMLRAAHTTPSVKKFILTSSIASIYNGYPPSRKAPFTEKDWTILDGPNVIAYHKSKTMAERAAWDFMDKNDTNFTLTAINPTFVLGPVPSDKVGFSTETMSMIMKGTSPGLINLYLPLVDIRDVVQAHIQAAKIPEAAGRRFILNQSDGGDLFLPEMTAILREEFNPMGYSAPSWVMHKWLVWLFSFFDSGLAAFYPLVDKYVSIDNSESRKILQLEYIPAKRTLIEGAHSMIEHGLIVKKPGYKKPELIS